MNEDDVPPPLPPFDHHGDEDTEVSHDPAVVPALPLAKPAWWRRRAGRRGTKSQRRALHAFAEQYLLPLFRGPPPDRGGPMFDPAVLGPSPSLEIGCGTGDVLRQVAAMYPDRGTVGAEVHAAAVAQCLERMEEERAKGGPDLRSSVRIYLGDVCRLLPRIPDGTMSRIVLAFPDPWCAYPVRRGDGEIVKGGTQEDSRYRTVQVSTVREIRRVLMKGGGDDALTGMFLLATDVPEYVEWTTKVVEEEQVGEDMWESVDPVPERSLWLPVTSKYEKKALEEGRSIHLKSWRRIR